MHRRHCAALSADRPSWLTRRVTRPRSSVSDKSTAAGFRTAAVWGHSNWTASYLFTLARVHETPPGLSGPQPASAAGLSDAHRRTTATRSSAPVSRPASARVGSVGIRTNVVGAVVVRAEVVR